MPFSQGTYHIYSKVLDSEGQKQAVTSPSTDGWPLQGTPFEPWKGRKQYEWTVDPGSEANHYHIYPADNYYNEHLSWGNEGRPLLTKWKLAYLWVIKEVDAAYCTIQDGNGRYWALQPSSVSAYDDVVLVNRDIGDRARWLIQKP